MWSPSGSVASAVRIRSPAFHRELVNMTIETKRLSMPSYVCRESSVEAEPVSGKPALVYVGVSHSDFPSSTFLRPFAPPALPGFIATMDALTPGQRFFVPVGSSGSPARQLRPVRPGLSALCAWPSDPSVSKHLTAPRIALARYPSASAASLVGSGLRLWLAGSPVSPAESSSLALRTSRSLPVASHPSSRRRSYVRLQAGERMPEKDSHLSDQTHLQTH